MKTSGIMDFINELEARFPVDQWTIDRIHIWPVIRRKIYFDALPMARGNLKRRSAWAKALCGTTSLFRLLGKSIKWECLYQIRRSHLALLGQPQDVVFFNSSSCGCYDLVNNRWYSRHIDSLRTYFKEENISCLTIIDGWDYLDPLHSDSVFVQKDIVLSRIRGLALSRFSFEGNKELPLFEDFERFLKKDASFSAAIDLASIPDCVYQIRCMSEFLKEILRKASSKMGLSDCYYDTARMAFNLACHELGIPSLDMQHGLQGENHVAYGRWDKVPKDGYELLPSLFWCWDESDVKAIRRWSDKAGPHHNAIKGGNLYLRKWVSGDAELVETYDSRIREIKSRNQSAIHVLYSLNGVSPCELDKLLAIVKAAIVAKLSCFFWIKMHPNRADSKKTLFKLLAENAPQMNWDIYSASQLPLPALLRNIDVHVTEYSSVVKEAEFFGVPSVLIDRAGADTFPEYVSSGWAEPADSAEEALSAIRTQADRKNTLMPCKNHSEADEKAAINYLVGIVKNAQ